MDQYEPKHAVIFLKYYCELNNNWGFFSWRCGNWNLMHEIDNTSFIAVLKHPYACPYPEVD